MKNKTQAVLGLLFLSSFTKSFFIPPQTYDVVTILVIATIYGIKEYLNSKVTITDVQKLTDVYEERLKLQDEEIEKVKNSASRMSLAAGVRR